MKPTLILLHGWGFYSSVWESFLPYLENQFNILAIDLLGYGKNTDFTSPLTLEKLTQDVLQKSPDSALFLGWSLGGLVAMNIAIQHPKRITQLITIASTPKFIEESDWPGISAQILDQLSVELKKDYQATLQQFLILQFQGSSINRRLLKSLKKQFILDKPPSETVLNDNLMVLKKTDLRKELIKIQCPQFHIFGRQDTIVPTGVAKKIQTLTSNAHIEILPHVSHAPFLSNPMLCEKIIKNFYENHRQ